MLDKSTDGVRQRGGAGQDDGWDTLRQALPEKRRLPLVAEVVDTMGFGLAQVKAGVVGGGLMFADGTELLLISGVARSVADDWGLKAFERGAVVSVVFMGMCVGALISGPLGDTFGRRRIMCTLFFGICIFGLLSSMADSVLELMTLRFFLGVFIGVGQPVWFSLGAELTPTYWRVVTTAVSNVWFAFGGVYSASIIMLDDPGMKQLHWRTLLQVGSIPAACFGVLALLLLPESPTYLVVEGRRAEAVAILEEMRADNGAADACVDFRLPPARQDRHGPWWQQLGKQAGIVFGSQLRVTTLVTMYSMATLNLFYYGCMYAIPQVLPDISGDNAAWQVLLGTLFEFPGYALGLVAGMCMARKAAMKLYLLLGIACLLAFAAGSGFLHSSQAARWLTLGGFYGIKVFTMIGMVVCFQYVVEVYPTEARITGSAMGIAAGRVASTLGPIIYEVLTEVTGDFRYFFLLVAVICFVNVGLIDFLRYETMGKPLQDTLEEDLQEEQKG